jgi:acyl dehydratase
LTLNTAPHFDVTAKSFEQFGGVLMNSCITLGVVQGLCGADFGPAVLPNRGFGEIRMTAPVFANDTLHAESTILEKQPASPERGACVRVRTAGYNQHGNKVIEFDRAYVPFSPGAWRREIEIRTRAAPRLDRDRVYVSQIEGPLFEDFEVGDLYDHQVGRTLLAEESIWFSLLHLNQNPCYIDLELATREDPRGVPIDDTFVLSTVTGIGVKHTTQNALANLGWTNVEFHTPVFSRDTLRSETQITGLRRSKSRPQQGIVSVKTLGRNQREELVLSFERTFLTRCRSLVERWRGSS